MPSNLIRQFEQVFGNRSLEPALFYKWPIGLRFELGGDGWGDAPHRFYTQRFYQAMVRSKALLQYVFKDSKNLVIELIFYTGKKTKAPAKELEKCGFTLPAEHELTYEPYEYGYIGKISFAEKIASSNVHAILWAIISNEIGIRPTAGVSAYFIDLDKGIVAHPYDHRGMDIVANGKEALVSCYTKFNEWILDYDREKIDAIFK